MMITKRKTTNGLQTPASIIPLTPSNTSKVAPSPASVQSCSRESSRNACAQKLQFDLSDKDHVNHLLRKYIQWNYINLKQKLDPDGIADRLCEFDIMDDAERTKIEEAGYHDIKSDILLKFLVRYLEKLPKGDDTFIGKVFSAFKLEKCEYLLTGFGSTDFKYKDNIDTNAKNVPDIWKEKLSDFEQKRGDELDAKQIIDKLLQKEVLQFDEHENIQDMKFKPDKLKYLIKYIQKKTSIEFYNFVQVLEEEYPHICNDLKDFEIMDFSISTEKVSSSVSIVPRTIKISNSEGYAKVSELQLSLPPNGRDIEQMVVDSCENENNDAVTEEMMELGATDVLKYEFACIRLTLMHLSTRSKMQIYSKLKESPEKFSNILKHLFTHEHFRMMKERNIHSIDFRLEMAWPDAIITRDVIAEHYCFLKEKIEPNYFVDLLKSTNAPQDVINVMKDMQKSRPSRCTQFLLFLVNDENSPIDMFHAKLKELKMDDVINVLMSSSKKISNRLCSCRLTKSVIVDQFSTLVQEMKDVDGLLDSFAHFSGFDKSIKNSFEELRNNDKLTSNDNQRQSSNNEQNIAQMFLREILDMSENEASEGVCLLEEEIRKTEQGEMLLKQVLEKQFKTEECAIMITRNDIKRNRSFLRSQLEPRRFLDMLRDIDGIDEEREKISSQLPKQTRCDIFMGLLENHKVALEKFGPALKRLRLTKIIQFLYDARTQGSEEYKITKGDIERNSGFLQEELEPRNFLNMLREIKGTDEDIENILSSSPRRIRCLRFYNILLNASEIDLEKFEFELKQRHMPHVIAFLINSRPGRFYDTTHIKEALVDSYKCVIDEIEPSSLETIFIEREVYTKKEFEEICNPTSRRARAINLMQDIMKGPVSKSRCLMNSLDAVGYVSLVKMIRKEIDAFKTCPRLFKKTHGITDCCLIEGQFEIEKIHGCDRDKPYERQGKESDCSNYALEIPKHVAGDTMYTMVHPSPNTANESPVSFVDRCPKSVPSNISQESSDRLQTKFLRRQMSTSKSEMHTLLSPTETFKQQYGDYCPSFSVESDTSDLSTPAFAFNPSDKTKYSATKLIGFLQMNYKKIKSQLYPDELADILFSKDLITKSHREIIHELNHRMEKCDKLIKSIVKMTRKTLDEERFVTKILDSFKKAKYGYLVDDFANFEEPSDFNKPQILDSQDDTTVRPEDRAWTKTLSNILKQIGEEIDLFDIIDTLLVKGILTFKEHQSIIDASPINRLKVLEELISQKTKNHFIEFHSIIESEYPRELKFAHDNNTDLSMDTTTDINSPVIEMQVLEEVAVGKDDIGETGIKLEIKRAAEEARDIEQMIVEHNSPKPGDLLVEMVSEDVHCGVKNVKFSCIEITFECMSEQSRMLLLQKCKDSDKFLKRWVWELIDRSKIDSLKRKEVKEVKIKIQINWPDFVISRQDIARNYVYLKTNLEPKHYSKIFQNSKGTHNMVLKSDEDADEKTRCKQFILFMVTNEHAPLEKLSAELKETKIMEHIKENAKYYKTCACKLTKKKIVEHFTFLEKEMKHVDEMIEIFIDFYTLNNGKSETNERKANAYKTLNDDKNKKRNEPCKTEAFLRMILKSENDDIQVCLFGEALVDTGQEQILRKVLIKTEKSADFYLTKDDIRRNESFLLQEMEPMLFVTMVSDKDVREQILETNSREQRCKLFLNFLQKCDSTVIEKFTSKLQRLNLKSIINYLYSSRRQGHFVTKDDISRNKAFLEDMLEPKKLQDIFTSECRLDAIMCTDEHVLKRFTTYLENEKPEIVTYLVQSREEDMNMRSVKESLLEAYSCIVSDIEPKRITEMFVEKGEISRDVYNSICSKPTRRGRAIELMSKVIAGPLSRAQCMIEALEFYGYRSLVQQIRKNEEAFKRCPRIYRLRKGVRQSVAFEGTMHIKYDSDLSAAPLSDALDKNIFQEMDPGATPFSNALADDIFQNQDYPSKESITPIATIVTEDYHQNYTDPPSPYD